MATQSKTISIVVPVYNSAEILPVLVDRLAPVIQELADQYELLLINDGSCDTSWNVISGIVEKCPWVRGIDMMRNYGQHNALLCGIREARFDLIITMDDDLQHPPEEIPKLLSVIDQGFDVVYGSPNNFYQNWWRSLFSGIIRRLLILVMGAGTFRNVSAFRVIRTELRNSFAEYHNADVLVDVLFSWGTTRFASIPVKMEPRFKGKSTYSIQRLINTAIQVITSFSTLPLRIASFVGFAFMSFGILVFLYVVFVYLFMGSIPGFPFLASIISLFSGAQLFALGILGEYLAKMFLRSMNRPSYVVRETTLHRRSE